MEEKEQAMANQIQLQQIESASVVEQPAEPLYNRQQEANEFELDPFASLSGSSRRYFGHFSSNRNGDNNKNEWEPGYSEVIESLQQANIPTTSSSSAAASDDNLARLSHYMSVGAKNHHQSATFAKPILVNQAAPSGQLPLDYLTAYLNAIYSGNNESLQQNNGHFSSSSSNNGGESLPWSSQAVRNLLTVAAGFGNQPLVGNLVANAYATGNGNKIRQQHLASQKLTTSGKSQFESHTSVARNSNLTNYHLLHLFALLAAILGALFAIKIFIQTGDKQQFIRRRLTSSSNEDDNRNNKPFMGWFKGLNLSSPTAATATTVGQVVEKASGKESLEAANFVHKRRVSDEKNSKEKQQLQQQLDLEAQQAGIAAKNFDLLTQKLVNLLNFKSDKADVEQDNQQADSQAEPKSDKFSISTQELDEASSGSTNDILVLDSENGKSQRFRTSRSYIKSLIDALTKAKSQVSSGFSGNRLSNEGNFDDDDEEEQATVGLLEGLNKEEGSKDSSNISSDSAVDVEQQQEAGILTSQMDISAAHLILAYMEKHLEDKERLQREWRELNDNSSFFDCKSGFTENSTPKQQKIVSKLANNAKVSQLMMQKLARVALSDDNKGKNRNSSIVPYDRNRVKLSVPTATPVVSSSNTKVGQQKVSTGDRSQAVTRASDYINASYIYDDDPRMPTHIIAQGPNEQTLGAFWQVSCEVVNLFREQC